MAKHVDFSHLPTKFYRGRTLVDWEASIGMTVTTAYGEARITSFTPAAKPCNLEIEFLDTGFKVECLTSNLKKGEVKDFLHRSVCGVGYIGKGPYRSRKKVGNAYILSYEYSLWAGIIQRCYTTNHSRVEAYKDCSVDERWHCFQTFCEDLPSVPGYDLWKEWKESSRGEEINLDKDGAVPGNKVYGPTTTQFISASLNKSMGARNRHCKEKH